MSVAFSETLLTPFNPQEEQKITRCFEFTLSELFSQDPCKYESVNKRRAVEAARRGRRGARPRDWILARATGGSAAAASQAVLDGPLASGDLP